MLSFFPLDVLDEIWDIIESVSEAFLTYSFITKYTDIFVKTMREASHIFSAKNIGVHVFHILTFKILTKP